MSVTAVPLQPIKRAHIIWLWVGLIVAVAAALLLAWQGTRGAVVSRMDDAAFLAWHAEQPGIEVTESGLQYQVLDAGTGPQLAEGDGVTLTVQGELRDGTEFQPEAPMQFQIGQPMIPGFTEGVKLMRNGARYRFWLPPELGYVSQPGQPPNEITDQLLIFDVNISEVITAEMLQQMMLQQMMQGDPNGGGAEDGAVPAEPEAGQ